MAHSATHTGASGAVPARRGTHASARTGRPITHKGPVRAVPPPPPPPPHIPAARRGCDVTDRDGPYESRTAAGRRAGRPGREERGRGRAHSRRRSLRRRRAGDDTAIAGYLRRHLNQASGRTVGWLAPSHGNTGLPGRLVNRLVEDGSGAPVPALWKGCGGRRRYAEVIPTGCGARRRAQQTETRRLQRPSTKSALTLLGGAGESVLSV